MKTPDFETTLIVLTLMVGIACGGLAGALVMRQVVVIEARLAGCEVYP